MVPGWQSKCSGRHPYPRPDGRRRILPNGTAYITDLGMTGPYKSVLGRDIDRVIKAIITQMPTRFDVAEKDVRMSGAIITIDSSTGKALEIKRLVLHDSN